MTRKTYSLWTYLILLLTLVVAAMAITIFRGDLLPFDPKLTLGLSVLTLVAAVRSLGAVLAVNAIVGFLLRRPVAVVLWIPFGTALMVLAHLFLGPRLGLVGLDRIGWFDAFLMYLPSVGLFSLIGGFLGTLLRRR